MLQLKFVPSERWSTQAFAGKQIVLIDENDRLAFWTGDFYAAPESAVPIDIGSLPGAGLAPGRLLANPSDLLIYGQSNGTGGYSPIGGPAIIEAEGAPVTPRTNLNFSGAVTVGDAGGKTNVIVQAKHVIEDEGVAVAVRDIINVTGAGVTVTDVGGKTVFTIPGGAGNLATDALWDAVGDLAVGTGANTAAKLPIGAALNVLRVNAGATGLEWAAPAAATLASDTLWDAVGDLAVGSGSNTAVKLPRGSALQILRVRADLAGLEWTNPPTGSGVAADVIWNAVGDLAVGTGADSAGILSKGTALQVLRVNASGTGLEWAAQATGSGVASDVIFDAVGDLPVGSGSNTSVRLPMGAPGQVLSVNAGGTGLAWVDAPFTPQKQPFSGAGTFNIEIGACTALSVYITTAANGTITAYDGLGGTGTVILSSTSIVVGTDNNRTILIGPPGTGAACATGISIVVTGAQVGYVTWGE